MIGTLIGLGVLGVLVIGIYLAGRKAGKDATDVTASEAALKDIEVASGPVAPTELDLVRQRYQRK